MYRFQAQLSSDVKKYAFSTNQINNENKVLFYQNFEIKFYQSYFCLTIFYGSEIISIDEKPKRLLQFVL